MPNKTSKKKRVVALPKIPKELIDQMVSGPMDAEAVNAASMAFKKALIERILGAELSHHLGYPPGAEKPGETGNHRNGATRKTVNQHGKLTRDPGKSALKSCHPGDVQPSGAFAGAAWGDTHGIHSRNQTASFCGR